MKLKDIFFFLKPKKVKSNTIFGKTLRITIGEESADDEIGDKWFSYEVKGGKVRKKTIRKIRRGNTDYEKYDLVELTPITRTAVILYKQSYAGQPPRITRVRLFKDFKGKKKLIKLNTEYFTS